MSSTADRESVLRLTSDIHDLGRLYPWLDQAAVEESIPADIVPRMHVALEEAVANAAFHGFEANTIGQITVRLSVAARAAVLVVEDNGAPFDPTSAPVGAHADSLAEVIPGGWGLELIRRFCPAVAYERRDELNHLTMRFPFSA